MVIAGIMSGTSLDGIDVAICDFNTESDSMEFKLLAANTFPFSNSTRQFIEQVINKEISVSLISNLSALLSELYAQSVIELCVSSGIALKNIDAIAVHGQTVWHQPVAIAMGEHSVRSTLQLIDAPLLSHRTGIKVIFDFRSADIALGGQGAPLVPIFDKAYFRNREKDVICLNIGGIANITYLPMKPKQRIKAFDTGPGNMLIDLAMKYYFTKNFDDKGQVAESGTLKHDLLVELLSNNFIFKIPPKSTGSESFGQHFLAKIIAQHYLAEDVVATLTHFTVESIAHNIETFCTESGNIIVSGGGSANKFMMRLLQKRLPNFETSISDEWGIHPDYKEAIAFAYLGLLNLMRLPGNLPEVTGASRRTILGSRYEM
ncbi:MAG: anhydro-N-acetylmuramic acid kinase [Ignavibacteriae bacterium HGW-Ignavibacteriae-1]|jgi:anhydro-N-acetylmuramic acid kinase|nr:MAG: anhydro-N-acetylmuramic acid kinase [Ignavibacteriae bacterium HGW-Ignavibacteriae-1]